ncbi:MAG: reverse transcriptase domain-containing protein [Dehalococcoidia bacterium]
MNKERLGSLVGWRSRRQRTPLYESLCQIETLTQAWRTVRRRGGVGMDGQTAAAFEEHWAENMAELAAELRERRYHPRPLRHFSLPKPDGGQRPISLLALRDRIVQRAVLDLVRPIFEQLASPAAFGALPGRGVGEALARAERARRDGNTWIVRGDLHAFFEEVDHGRVLSAFREAVQDEALTALVAEWLAGGILQSGTDPIMPPLKEANGHGGGDLLRHLRTGLEMAQSLNPERLHEWPPLGVAAPVVAALAGRVGANAFGWSSGRLRRTLLTLGAGTLAAGALAAVAAERFNGAAAETEAPRGTPQGSSLSPLLATGILQPLDQALNCRGGLLVRYVDDILLVCADEQTAERGLAEVRRQVDRLGLSLNEKKTRVQPYDEGFSFLGATLPQEPLIDPERRALIDGFQQSGYWRARRLLRGKPSYKAKQRAARGGGRTGERLPHPLPPFQQGWRGRGSTGDPARARFAAENGGQPGWRGGGASGDGRPRPVQNPAASPKGPLAQPGAVPGFSPVRRQGGEALSPLEPWRDGAVFRPVRGQGYDNAGGAGG